MGEIHEHAGWFLYPLIIVGVIWFWRGGTEYLSSHEPYIKPAAPLSTGETYGEIYLSHDEAPSKLDLPENPIITIANFFSKFRGGVRTATGTIPFSKTFILDGIAGADATDPQNEYVRLIANHQNTLPLQLSGLILTGSAYATNVTLPQAVNTLVLGSSMVQSPVVMPPLGRALITSGKSPIGTSFRVNMCTGYLDQFQTFTPELRMDCPNPGVELKAYGPYEDASCRSFVDKLPVCQSFNGSFPSDMGASCKKFITEKLSYNACVADHSSDKDFYKDEWRLFLGKDSELWKDKKEVIRLYDTKGTIVDGITY